MTKNLIGLDIGGTKCAVVYGVDSPDGVEVKDKIRFETLDVDSTLSKLKDSVKEIMAKHDLTPENVWGIGISCGGPLDSKRGIIMSPPNLPGWDNIKIVDMLEKEFGIKSAIQNDANACALAEWKYGAGKGSENMVFMTFGTGLGAGLILNGELYDGENGNAGEVGHIRLAEFGPVGFGKSGSFEGFCSGGGIAQLANIMVKEKSLGGDVPALCREAGGTENITAKLVAEMAEKGDDLSLDILKVTGRYLGKGLSIIIDILNPGMVVIGSIFARCGHLFSKYADEVIEKEALSEASAVCKVVPATLGESIGDIAALSVAANIKK